MPLFLENNEEGTIKCPRCEEVQPACDFHTLGMSPRYAPQLVPIYRCKLCNHLFALRADTDAKKAS